MVQKLKPPIWTDLPTMDSDLLNFIIPLNVIPRVFRCLLGYTATKRVVPRFREQQPLQKFLNLLDTPQWMTGKWHLNKQPTDFGFQKYWGHLSGATNFLPETTPSG